MQGTWTPNARLTINPGLRVEKEEVPSYVEGLSGIDFSFGDKIAPRVGATYDLKGDGKWKVYGSYGIYYDLFKLELPRGAFGGDKWIEILTLDTLDWPSIGPNGNFPARSSKRPTSVFRRTIRPARSAAPSIRIWSRCARRSSPPVWSTSSIRRSRWDCASCTSR